MTEPPDEIAPLVAALRDSAEWLDACGAGAIIGGVAVALLGRPRATRDIDCLLIAPEQTWPTLLEKAALFGILPRMDDPLAFAAESRVLLLRHDASFVDLDVMLGSIPFEERLVANAIRMRVARVTLPVARAEDLIVMKAIAGRPRDLADIEGLLDAQPIDKEFVREQVRRFAELLDRPDLATDLERLL